MLMRGRVGNGNGNGNGNGGAGRAGAGIARPMLRNSSGLPAARRRAATASRYG
ncbi:hypothetical protein BDSB_21135 [Burkholderia dolosa PC543]|nr:hypothetical protein BDSB_21135 [Burkholderia dolosa PC543]